jgi:uncharacterized membrane protein YccC
LHRVAFAVVVVAASIVLGLWVSRFRDVPLLPATGAAVGLLVGLAAVWLSLHDFHHQRARATVRRRHH